MTREDQLNALRAAGWDIKPAIHSMEELKGLPVAIKMISEEEWDLIHHSNQEFYYAFSALVNEALRQVPEHCKSQLEMMLSETANVYSRNEEAKGCTGGLLRQYLSYPWYRS